MAQPRVIRIVFRETGMALAMLAVWMLCLFAPLHQSAGALRDMAKAGVDISGAWSICVSIAQSETDPDKAVPDCPAQGIAKTGLSLPVPADFVAIDRDVVDVIDRALQFRLPIPPPRLGRIQPRAPPSMV